MASTVHTKNTFLSKRLLVVLRLLLRAWKSLSRSSKRQSSVAVASGWSYLSTSAFSPNFAFSASEARKMLGFPSSTMSICRDLYRFSWKLPSIVMPFLGAPLHAKQLTSLSTPCS
ncbi:hypothetical protein FB192DRAFT_1376738 [Mucor lusitanicus]|uniref:Secreted protein n=1 Tax=Mucor circinelloides f. lusitanicus TaxID=29924 RepID=A0A8H4BHE8_MUCCL|nr:hypothetical protein FB192DRAFT_1376738 [Mucor lusitanicus]